MSPFSNNRIFMDNVYIKKRDKLLQEVARDHVQIHK